MKIAFVYIIVALFLVSGVMAVTNTFNNNVQTDNHNIVFVQQNKPISDNNANILCTNHNNDDNSDVCEKFYESDKYFTIATWKFSFRNYVLADKNPLFKFYNTKVIGNLRAASWTSNPNVYSVLVKSGTKMTEFTGGTKGELTSKNDISQITLCGKKIDGGNGGGPGPSGVPEFSLLSMGAAIAVVTMGLLFLRKN